MATNKILLTSRIKTSEAGQTLLEFLVRRFTYHDAARWQERIADGRVTVNGQQAEGGQSLAEGDNVGYLAEEVSQEGVVLDYDLAHADEHILVVDKPAPLAVHAHGKYLKDNLIYLLRKRFGPNVSLVHRLDRETSGLMVVSRKRRAMVKLQQAFSRRAVDKGYTGIVFGEVRGDFSVELPIGPHPTSRINTKWGVVPEGGKPARTDFKVLERRPGHTLLEIVPLTGRTNQIRVHLEHSGFPLVGDKAYNGGDETFLEYYRQGLTENVLAKVKMRRQALHASKLSFKHPGNGKQMEFESAMPDDMRDFWETLEK